MTWDEFSTLLAGIMPESPLGQVVSIRSEDDKDMLKNFSKEQNKIRNDWRRRMATQLISNETSAENHVKQFQEMMKQAFSS